MIKKLAGRFAGFSGVGAVVTLFSMALLWVFSRWFGMGITWAYVLSYAVSIQVSFLLNMKYVFRSTFSAKNWVSFNLVYLAGMAVGAGVLNIFIRLFAGTDRTLLGYAVIPFTLVFNFFFINYVIKNKNEKDTVE